MVHDGEAAPKVPTLLLHLFATALLACITAGAFFSIYWFLNDTLSTYRRQMNAAAYNAQLFFDQREILLRSLSSSAVRNTDGAAVSETPRYFGNSQQIEVIPLQESGDAFDWALILTPRDLNDVALAHTQLVYTSVRNGRSSLILTLPGHDANFQNSSLQQWLANALTAADQGNQRDGRNSIVWLKPPMDRYNLIYLYTPMDSLRPKSGWIGLEVGNIDAAIDLSSMTGGRYALYDQHGTAVLHSAPTAVLADFAKRAPRADSFGLWGAGFLPEYVVLNKSVGDDGWRLVYYAPITRILSDTALALQITLATAVLLFTAVILGVRNIQQKLVGPAMRQYQALAESVSLNRKLIEVAPVGLCMLRRTDGAPILSNERARQWLLSDAALLPRILAFYDGGLGNEHLLPDGRCVHLAFAPITYRGEIVVLCGINDISAFKQVETSIMQAKREAEAANQAKTMFLATMSHEIRTPLFGILGTLEMLGLTAVDQRQQQYLDTMQQSSATLLRTINDTLDLSSIEAGHLALESSAFNPVELLDSVIISYAARAESKDLRIYAVVDVDTPAAVLGDATRIRQILNNLVSNAIKFAESGQVVVRLHVDRPGTDTATLSFQVADTGVGIAPEHHAHLFEPYYRADTGQAHAVPGTGLGLAICHRLSVLMGGSLSATSEPGLGTSISFSIVLPVTAAVDDFEGIALDPTPVYVRGAVNEIVKNLCSWLRHWGALAMPYPVDGAVPDDAGILVETWPRSAQRIPWAGARVMAQGPGARSRQDGGHNNWTANAFSLYSIGRAVRQAQDGVAATESLGHKGQRDALNLHLLVVEDNPISLQILQEQVEHLGCTVVAAVNGREVLARSDISAFDAILTDLQMPHVDGRELTRRLRAQGYTRPILGITANAFAEDLRLSAAAGMTSVLLKPLPIAVLRQTLLALKEAL